MIDKNPLAILKILLCVLLIFFTSGCWNVRELNTLAIVTGIGIEKAEQPGKIKLTIQIIKAGPKKSEEPGSGAATWNTELTGDTVFEALRNFTHRSGRRLFLSHNEIIIFSHNLAKEGVQKYIDFFARNYQIRRTAWVFVAQGNVDEVLTVDSELDPISGLEIARLMKNESIVSESSSITLQQFLSNLMSITTAPIAPLIKVSGEGQKKRIYVYGTAVFKEDKLVGELDDVETSGLLWATGKMKRKSIHVKGPKGKGIVSLETIKASSKIIPEIDGNNVHITVKIKEEGILTEQTTTDDFLLPSAVKSLEKSKAAVIQSEVNRALKKSQKLNVDIFGFGDIIYKKHPVQWRSLQPQWKNVFPHIRVTLRVDTKLRRMGLTLKPPIKPAQE